MANDRYTLERYSRQVFFGPIGEAGQKKLRDARVTVIGCGALGTVQANLLGRAGVGFIRIIDRDFIEESNLQRQVLFDEKDIADGLPKAAAAERRLRAINSTIDVEGIVSDVNYSNIESFIDGADIVIDGLDNFETRYLINDACVKHGKPWVYGAAVGSYGLSMTILPGETPCLRCVFETAPPAEMNPTCDTAGVLGSLVSVIGSIQVAEAVKYLVGDKASLNKDLLHIDLWRNDYRRLKIARAREKSDCPVCKHGRYEFLTAQEGTHSTSLCGRNAVQITMRGRTDKLDFNRMTDKLKGAGGVSFNKFMLKFSADGCDLTVFPDGRAIIKGTDDHDRARVLYAKYVGN